MKSARIFSYLGISFALFCGFIPVTAPAADNPMDVIMLMDSSGSMKKTDPKFLRNPAAKLFISLLGEDDRVSIVSFSDEGYPVSYLSSAKNPSTQQRHFAAVDKISTKGGSTNIPAALETAMKVYRRNAEPNRQLHLILMTDGKVDVGSAKKNRELKQDLMQRIVPELAKQGIRLHGIAFTDHSDSELLKQLSQQTGGRFYLAKTDKDLHSVYTAIFENTKTPNQIPFNGDKFVIDNSISEATVIGSKSGNNPLTLVAPNGQRYTNANAPAFVKWMETPQFDLITINTPQPGAWQLESSDNNNKAYVITDLELKTEFTPARPDVGEGVLIKSWLEEKSQKLTKTEILSNLSVNINVSTPEGETHRLEMEPYSNYDAANTSQGIFASYIAFPSKGQFQLNIQFDGKTFSRKAQLAVPVGLADAEIAGSPLGQAVADVVSNDLKQQNNPVSRPDVQPGSQQNVDSTASETHAVDGKIKPPVAPKVKNDIAKTPSAQTAENSPVTNHINLPLPQGQENPINFPGQTQMEAQAAADGHVSPPPAHADPREEISLPSEGALAADAYPEAAAEAKEQKAKKQDKAHSKSKSADDKKNAPGKDEHGADKSDAEAGASSPLMIAIFVFVGINALLALIGGGAYWYLQRKKRAQNEDAGETDEKELPASNRKEPQISSKAA